MSRTASGRGGLWAAAGSVIAALVASACCWLPLLLLAFGVSAAGVSARFEAVRPYFLGVAALLLGAGFYVSYFRAPSCVPGDACAAANKRRGRFQRAMLWIAAAMVVAVGLFPNYIGSIVGDESPPAVTAGADGVTIGIDGMTCEACTPHVKAELLAVPGVRGVSVSYSKGSATVVVDAAQPPAYQALAEAVERSGYTARPR